MLRNPLPTKEQKNDYWRSWHKRNHPEIETINRIENFSGEIIMTDDPNGDNKNDPGLPQNIAGSHYFLSQRSLGLIDFTNDWLNQIAYSYAFPHLAIRTKTGHQSTTPNTWMPWEFTVMSGVIAHTEGDYFKFYKNRNSNIAFIAIQTDLVNKTNNEVLTKITSPEFRPKETRTIPVLLSGGGQYSIGKIRFQANGDVILLTMSSTPKTLDYCTLSYALF